MKRKIVLGLLVGTAACNPFDTSPILTGSVYYVYATPGALDLGEIGVERTAVGRVRVYIDTWTPIRIRPQCVRCGALDSGKGGDFRSFAVGDSVMIQYDEGGTVLDSDPPVWPVTSIEIVK